MAPRRVKSKARSQPSSLLRAVAAAMARVMSGCRPSSAIRIFSASSVVPAGEVTFSRSLEAGSLAMCTSSPAPATVTRALHGEVFGQPRLDARFRQALDEQEHIGRAAAGDGGNGIDEADRKSKRLNSSH